MVDRFRLDWPLLLLPKVMRMGLLKRNAGQEKQSTTKQE